jgi:ubiquinone/menaquinone biosynthesis C-methylase UbiE
MSERYTLGYSDAAMRFLLRRTLETHGAFFLPHLRPGLRVLDCGCGPGSITLGIASRVAPGSVDAIEEHLQKALEREITAVFLDQPVSSDGGAKKHALN